MENKLKTLKDLEVRLLFKGDRLIEIDKIKAEAVKWVKEYQKKETEECKKWMINKILFTEHREFQLYYQGIKDGLIMFHNIQEEDLNDGNKNR